MIIDCNINGFLHNGSFISRSGPTESVSRKQKRVMIVEDEMIVAMDLASFLDRNGFEIVGLAQSGIDAVTLAVHSKPDIIIMDIDLPGTLDGIAAAEKIENQIVTTIIFASAHHLGDPRIDKIINEGGYKFINKPYQGESVRDMILHE
ncbi:response regulator [bacterium]|nr:response regulator [bacterium]